jgi:hypothetical protein
MRTVSPSFYDGFMISLVLIWASIPSPGTAEEAVISILGFIVFWSVIFCRRPLAYSTDDRLTGQPVEPTYAQQSIYLSAYPRVPDLR